MTVSKHHHGVDCCLACFTDGDIHPEHDGDPACAERADDTGRCVYAPPLEVV